MRGFVLASGSPGGTIGSIPEYPLIAGYAENQGALVYIDANGACVACGADPALIAGVTNAPGGTDTSGFNITGHKEFPAGYMQIIALMGGEFRAFYVGALPTAAGGQFGVVRDADGYWKVDFDEVVNVAVQLVSLELTAAPQSQAEVLVKFLPGVIQII